MELLLALFALLLFEVAAWRWGADSRIWAEDERAIARRSRRAI